MAELHWQVNALVQDGQYRYKEELQQWEACVPLGPEPKVSVEVSTPLQADTCASLLAAHPDQWFAQFIVRGIQQGFRIGFDRSKGASCRPSKGNMSIPQPELVTQYLEREVSLGRMKIVARTNSVHTSPIGLIPKKGKPGRWRLIDHLSSPDGGSVNNGIDRNLASLKYPTVDHLAMLVRQVGRGACLVKADVKEAFRNIPIHPDDRWLLGVEWGGVTYVDKVLPFGLRSAPKIFSAIADAAQWILVQRGVPHVLHYLDDFIVVEREQEAAIRARETLEVLFDTLGLPLEPEKLEGPSRHLKFLGIMVDTVNLRLQLPEEKRQRLKEEINEAQGRKAIAKRELQSLTGLLQHAAKVIRRGRAFLHHLYALESIGSAPWHRIRLNAPARADLLWWGLVVPRWNGISALWDVSTREPDILVASDASGSWGCGVYWLRHWVAVKWPPQLQETSIQVKEMIPVVLAAALGGKYWGGKMVRFRVDNRAVVDIVNGLYSHEPHLMHLLRLLVFFAATYDFWFKATHIAGSQNTLADALSRDNLSLFLSQGPSQVDPHPLVVPESLMALLALEASWTSAPWRELFSLTLRQV